MLEDKKNGVYIFLLLSALLHVALYAALPKNILGTQEQAVRAVTILLEPAKVVEATVEPDKPKPKPEAEPQKPAAADPVVAEKQPKPEPKKQQEPQKPVQPSAAPVMLPESSVTSHGADTGAAAPVVPVGKGNDTGGTGFTDSKGTSRDIRRIETGEAPAPAPAPPPAPVRVATPPPPVVNVDLNAIRAEYAKRISAKINSVKEYPQGARRQGHEGKSYVLFTINREGGVTGVSVAKSSGYDTLDNAAQDAVRRAAPFPPLPRELGDSFTLRVPIVFKLSQE
jgi:periplasmic protein TonB